MKTQELAKDSGRLLVDSHVHFHKCFRKDLFFEAASTNFRLGARQLRLTTRSTGCLLFSEASKDQYFRQFQATSGIPSRHKWIFHTTAEDCSLIVQRNENQRLIVVAGRQIETEENLEVLALGYAGELPNGLTLQETVKRTVDTGALAVIPWGFGKWWLRRGEVLRKFLSSRNLENVFLGDNSGRARLGGWPRFFRLAELQGIFVLPGSDPLPFPNQVKKPGSYGFLLEGELDERRPFLGLKRLLQQKTSQPRMFGRPESLHNFFVSQSRMQILKLRSRL